MMRAGGVVVGVVVVVVLGCSGVAAGSSRVFVDRDSLGGRCSDARSPARAASRATPWCSLERALAGVRGGTTVVVRRGSYPRLEVEDGGRRRSRFVTVRAARGESVSVAGVAIAGARFVRVRGLRVTGAIDLSRGARQLQFIANDVSPEGFRVRGVSDLLIARNHIHDLRRDPDSQPEDGYGIWMTDYNDRENRRITIRGNHLERIPHDAIQMGSVNGVVIEHNEIEQVRAICCEDHSDILQITDGDDIIVRSNYLHDSVHGVIVKAFTLRRIRFQDNVITRIAGGFGLNLYDIDGLSLIANSVWHTAAGVRLRDSDDNPATMRVSALRKNLIDHYSNECGPCTHHRHHNPTSRKRAPKHLKTHIRKLRRQLPHHRRGGGKQ